ncbi:CDP-diacylglycerol--serine O-phosphatidyltransferase [Pseudoalteromonas tunicata]|uniref:Phosphatidylserine synthase n=1 Tax=Pseudoalteromonas tunicata D2 TaxID=87626 RepID=A4CC65_9GAMM|nr:CDP-diacylglycerol--serine O-phosphatidyltransferase [Pseudoalteromonas tunicata]ATC94501.1 CDP-diacylglycerol---serine O-phosphatidyltransferase [Pseudoalteromonas tunicata]AXT30227.1 CDP-diacylglycerol--serine O-phosphatidyltransferase [Pseudoalteromonas tunicata]EAR27952.1 phosphatidylserine synthase [Pseudoalteromonas tunicata D2]
MQNVLWQQMPAFGLNSTDIEVLFSAKQYKQRLLSLIAQATTRIYLTALYLQDDEAGREILTALHEASLANPKMEVKVFVDYHRAQRGLIGASSQEGNAKFYFDFAKEFDSNVQIFGVPVKAKELFGVLHAKGFVFDDTVLYSGASLNNVYLQQEQRYRLDRYFILKQQKLADAMVGFLEQNFVQSDAVPRLDLRPIPRLVEMKAAHKQLVKHLKTFQYENVNSAVDGKIKARLFCGLARRGNQLNRTIKQLFESAQSELILYTPYFNFPAPLLRTLAKKLKQGVKVTIVVGDKTANDFYLPPEEPFSKIGALPYLYETILHRFLERKHQYIESKQLNVYLWKDDNNSFHLKGVSVDKQLHLLTGHNLNPRAWGLDLENGILLADKEGLLQPDLEKEKQQILAHCTQLTSYADVETIDNYPDPVKKILGQAKRVKVDFIIKRFI